MTNTNLFSKLSYPSFTTGFVFLHDDTINIFLILIKIHSGKLSVSRSDGPLVLLVVNKST